MIPLHDDNPTRIQPIVTVALIGLCSLFFVMELMGGERGSQQIIYSLGMIPAVLLQGAQLPPELEVLPPSLTVISSMFLHGGWMHLLGNMLYLWIFGNNVEDSMGHARFIVFYLICGIVAALSQALMNPASTIPMIGASGAISGVLGAYLLLYPYARVLVLIPLGIFSQAVRLPAMFVLGFWFLLQLFNSSMAAGKDDVGGVAFMAHIGGFVAGMILIPFFKDRSVRLFHPARRD
ncbi:MAG: rhomboid family intramembrane serine protease [Gammaproteobacteria bacterium]|nr:MAG: rhomboid family intramembrane serine protease [Gammaproteobacteria bacterium]